MAALFGGAGFFGQQAGARHASPRRGGGAGQRGGGFHLGALAASRARWAARRSASRAASLLADRGDGGVLPAVRASAAARRSATAARCLQLAAQIELSRAAGKLFAPAQQCGSPFGAHRKVALGSLARV